MTEVCRAPDMSFNGSAAPAEDEDARTEEEDSFVSDGESSRSPRCEAYVMTGDKMLLLNPKISPSYAKARQDQLPPATVVDLTESPRRRGPFDDFPSMHHKVATSGARRRFQLETSVPSSQSAHMLNGDGEQNGEEMMAGNGEDDDVHGNGHSSVTVHALGRNGASASTIQSVASARLPSTSSPTTPSSPRPGFKSEPASPAKYSAASSSNTADPCLPPSPDSSAPATPLKEKLRQLENGAHSIRPPMLSERDADAACRLAKRLFRHDGFKKSDIASHLARNNDFGAKVAHEYLQLFNFAGLRLDAALRTFLSHFCLTGESSERERVLVHFSRRYLQCNPSVFNNEDEVHTLTCALLLLNTDLHGQNIRKKMSTREFIDNLSNTGFTFKRDLLKCLYSAIKNAPIEWARDTPEFDVNSEGVRSNGVGKNLSAPSSGMKGVSLLQVPDPDSQVEYKNGWVMRKCVYDSDGKRTPLGRRGWKMFYATLKGMVLYLHKDERGFKNGHYQTFNNAVLIHHSVAQRPKDYVKKQHVFRLRTANLGEFLFQTSDPQEVQSWMDAINFVAAAFSSPALPAPVGSNTATFHKPLLPSAPTRLSMPEQAAEHDRKTEEINDSLERLRAEAPPLKARGKAVQEYFFKERFLDQEKERYSTYAALLRAKLQALTPATSAMMDSVDESEAPPDPQNREHRGEETPTRAHSQDRTSYREAIGWSSSNESD